MSERKCLDYRINTSIFGDGVIEQSLTRVDLDKKSTKVCTWICDTRDAGIRQALLELGWTPPTSNAEMMPEGSIRPCAGLDITQGSDGTWLHFRSGYGTYGSLCLENQKGICGKAMLDWAKDVIRRKKNDLSTTTDTHDSNHGQHLQGGQAGEERPRPSDYHLSKDDNKG